MAAGEYVSVSSQRDSEVADLALEARELTADPEGELRELSLIYEGRGLAPELARQVAEQLSRADRLAAHARDELGLAEARRARPWQAAWASAASFTVGGAVPVLCALAPQGARGPLVVVVTLPPSASSAGWGRASAGPRSAARRCASACGAPARWA
jgi:vacuolar iron transporter family protein